MKGFIYQYVKRSQKDYSLSFKLPVVREVESGNHRDSCRNAEVWHYYIKSNKNLH